MPSPAWRRRRREWPRWSREYARVCGGGRLFPPVRQRGTWAPTEKQLLAMFDTCRAWRRRWPWRWLPGRLRALVFATWYVPPELDQEIEADYAAFMREQEDSQRGAG